ncbi:class I adenylate-forming enzyme family protein [Streptomyces albipurpureus]|uniref:Acyl--CoA ligase n=1 Tax=Streptomyces albipurpureus TaxID=2897419 RepID=A0ABT0V0P2_9ACTN|nr:class I adenylate-forming enzyme family protein [Streptomyces sp. CWNU-1]MCM2393890.1 acyl--CoA ligase [Streptomyces sp. CWNU-1]
MPSAWPTNMPRSLEYPEVGVDMLLAGAARAHPHRVALRDGDETLTYAQLHDRALRVAAGLRARGIGPGDAVALHLPNTLWFLVAYYGILCAGAAAVPVNPAQPASPLRRQLADCGVQALFTHPANCAVFERGAVPEGLRFAVHVPASAAAPAPVDAELPKDAFPDGLASLGELLMEEPLRDLAVDPESVAHLQLTGGTTGSPKAVRVLHRNLVANILQVGCWRSATLPYLDETGALRMRVVPEAVHRHSLVPGQGVFVAVAPFFHSLGLVGHNVNTLLGTTVVIGGRFHPTAFLESVARHRANAVGGSPSLYYALLSSPAIETADLSSVTLLTSGAAPIDTSALSRLRAAFPNAAVTDGYGLSEATAAVAFTPSHQGVPPGAVGLPVFDTEIAIRGEDGGTPCPNGDTGEVWVRGPQIADGYHGRPELSAGQFVDGWLRTGDMGRLDENGYLFLAGRAKDMLIYKGYNVYPQPLEELLCSHPAIAQAAVVGRPDPVAGQIPVAFVVLRPPYVHEAGRGREFLDEVMAHVAAEVAPYQKVRDVHIVDGLPLTPTGKILKTELRKRWEDSGA